MATDEEQELKLKISHLAGKINRHKNQQAGSDATQHRYSPYNRQTNYYRGNSYGYHGQGQRPPHRNRSLIFHGAGKENNFGDVDSGTTSDASSASWVSRPYPNHQLINNSDSRRQYYAQKNNVEQRRILSHILRANSGGAGVANQNQHEIVIDGIRFLVTKLGTKLVKAPGDTNSPKATPKVAVVGGVKFFRTKNGNLYRNGIVKAQRHAAPIRKIDAPCKVFTSTGSCSNGSQCKYVHDPHKVAACKDFLLKGTCYHGDACDLSHDLTPERTPHCLHFAKDNCTKSDCKYTHVKVSPGAPVCHAFGRTGYCGKGADCTDRHVFECPDFSNTGVCKIRGCKLLHRERASVLRKASNNVVINDDDMDDLSSDDGQSVDSRDVDSDEVDEFIGQDDAMDFDIAAQRDFIEL